MLFFSFSCSMFPFSHPFHHRNDLKLLMIWADIWYRTILWLIWFLPLVSTLNDFGLVSHFQYNLNVPFLFALCVCVLNILPSLSFIFMVKFILSQCHIHPHHHFGNLIHCIIYIYILPFSFFFFFSNSMFDSICRHFSRTSCARSHQKDQNIILTYCSN